MTKKTNTQKRHDKIRKEFKRWQEKRKYSYSYIIEQLAHDHCLSERTIQNILTKEEVKIPELTKSPLKQEAPQ